MMVGSHPVVDREQNYQMWMQDKTLIASTMLLMAVASWTGADASDFQRDVRPILSQHCFACHGPDEEHREAGLRLDVPDPKTPLADLDIWDRLTTSDPDLRMPPPEFQKELSEEQIETLRSWIAGGAKLESHWAFVSPVRPQVADREHAIDFLIDREIQRHELESNPPAETATLLRRLCFDLTGLPPSKELIDKYPDLDSDEVVGQLVDQLLSSPDFGQHMARFWLDLVRYGDTHGLHLDNYREMWPYRDWVIRAFNDGMPFDQFVRMQLAGDLLPNQTDEALIASGFNRLNVTTNEGGSIYDEVFARNVIDRTDAFGTIFLGMTTGCAVCHDHKFDPLTMEDYYSLSAYFNSLDGRAMDQNIKNPAPFISVPTVEQRQQLMDMLQELRRHRIESLGPNELIDQSQLVWERSMVAEFEPVSVTLMPSSVESKSGVEMEVSDQASVLVTGKPAAKDTVTVIATLPDGVNWQTLHLEALVNQEKPRVGLSANGNVVLTEIKIETLAPEPESNWLALPIRYAVADVEQSDGPFDVSKAYDGKSHDREGWAVGGHQQEGPRNAWFGIPALASDSVSAGSKIRVTLEFQSAFEAHQFREIRLSLTNSPPQFSPEQRVLIGDLHSAGPFPVETPTLAYLRKYASVGAAFDAEQAFGFEGLQYRWHKRGDMPVGAVNRLPVATGQAGVVVLHQQIESPVARSIELLLGSDDGYQVYLNGKVVGAKERPKPSSPLADEYRLELQPGLNRLYLVLVNHDGNASFSYAFRSPSIAVPRSIEQLINTNSRGPAEQQALRQYYRKVVCLHPEWLALQDYERGILSAIEKLKSQFATTLVWKELDTPREARVLLRGQYDQPGAVVARRTPTFLSSMPKGATPDRLGLANWLTSADHPLFARVAVNRFWQQFFGAGLVRTSEDFGSQGELPSHPELLDWLAVDFQQSGWDVKQLVRQIVMSRAYRRSAFQSQRNRELDPENRWLARGPRGRLDAEMVRDQALQVSGLLNRKMGGPGVKPPQPEGLWSAVGYTRSNTARFQADTTDEVYRRSVYMFWKRTSPPPQMSILDAPSRESCTARRERTNTPLQALMLLNETQVFESAVELARVVMNQKDLRNDRERMTWVFRRLTARRPSQAELTHLLSLLTDMVEHYRQHPDAALMIGKDADAVLAAWAIVANTLLNLDEVLTK